DFDMPGEHDVVRHHNPVTKQAIMCNMRIGQKQAIAADDCLAATTNRAHVDGHAFTHRAIVTDGQRGTCPCFMQALRYSANDSHGKDTATAADLRLSRNHGM